MKAWKVAAVVLAGVAGVVVFARRAAEGEESGRLVAVPQREAPRRDDARRAGVRRVHRTAPVGRGARSGGAARK
jgi:hypothetical protein